jgi:peptidoglycan hydrolase-like protein with peptidoglycan-binding domain
MGNFSRKAVFGVAAALSAAIAASMTAGAALAAPATPVTPTAHVATATSAAPSWLVTLTWPLVQRPNKGERVYTVQYLLNAHGIRVGVDGDFGPATEDAVKKFQTIRGIRPVDGKVGNDTWPVLVIRVQYGSTGDAVRAVQRALRIPVDGIFGRGTEDAVRKFQIMQHVTGDPLGVVGEATWHALVEHE